MTTDAAGVTPSAGDYPVRYAVDYPEGPRNRLTVLFRLVLVIPILILWASLSAGGGGSWNGGGYSNAKVDALIEQAQIEPDPEKRRGYIRDAHRLHNEEVGHLALYHMMIPWAMATKVTVPHRADNQLEVRYVKVD